MREGEPGQPQTYCACTQQVELKADSRVHEESQISQPWTEGKGRGHRWGCSRPSRIISVPRAQTSRWLRSLKWWKQGLQVLTYQAGCYEAELLTRCQESRQRSITLASISENTIISMHCLNSIELANDHGKHLFYPFFSLSSQLYL